MAFVKNLLKYLRTFFDNFTIMLFVVVALLAWLQLRASRPRAAAGGGRA